MKKILAVLLALTVILSIGAMAFADDDTCVIGVSLDTISEKFWQAAWDSISAEAANYDNVKLEMLVAEGDAQKQNEQIETLIAMDVDYIICGLVDSTSIVTAIEACNDAGIPFMSVNRTPKGGEVAFNVSADNYELTYRATKLIADMAVEKGMKFTAIEIKGDLADTNAIARSDGFYAAIAEYPDLFDVVATIPTEWDADKALEGVLAAYQANPEINYIMSPADGLTIGASNALKQLGKWVTRDDENHVWITSLDGDSAVIQLVADGFVDVCSVQDIVEEGRLAVQACMTLFEGGEIEEPVVKEGGFEVTFENYESNEFEGF